VGPSIPAIKIANDADPGGIGCPDREKDACDSINFLNMGAQEAVSMPVLAFMKEVQVHITKQRRKAVGIMVDMFMVLVVMPDEAITIRHLLSRTMPFKKVAVFDALHLQLAFRNHHALGMWQENPYQDPVIQFTSPEYLERVMMTGLIDALQFRFKHGMGHVVCL
jgi:hypothetical protein